MVDIKWDQENQGLNEAEVRTQVHRSQSRGKDRPFIFQPIYTFFRVTSCPSFSSHAQQTRSDI